MLWLKVLHCRPQQAMQPRYCGCDSTRNRITPQCNAVTSATRRFSHRNGPHHAAATFPVPFRSIFIFKNKKFETPEAPTWVSDLEKRTFIYLPFLSPLGLMMSLECGPRLCLTPLCRSIVPLSPSLSFDLWVGKWVAGRE